ncbi:hypothetical protein HYW75_00070 [Candidatus Pacearchaeota archaeon]|nr:hypothetical protein [Candidatus Pacearchaeota archaeon]
MDINIFKEFGLTKNEMIIFLTLIKQGSLSATGVAKETGLNRPYLYYALERLREKGYLSEIKDKGKRVFKIVELDTILILEKDKVLFLEKTIEELKKLRAEKNFEENSVEVLKGSAVTKNIFRKMMTEIKPQEEILYLGLNEAAMEALEPLYLRRVLEHFRKNRITERIIIHKKGKTLSYAKTAQYKYLDQKLLGNTAKIIYQNTIIEILYGNPQHAIITKSKDIAETIKQQFEVFWKLAKSV